MVLCFIVDCGSKCGRDNGAFLSKVPSIVTNKGEEAEELSINEAYLID